MHVNRFHVLQQRSDVPFRVLMLRIRVHPDRQRVLWKRGVHGRNVQLRFGGGLLLLAQ